MFQDDDNDEDALYAQLKAHAAKSKKEFISGCYEAYDILKRDGSKALEEAEITSIQKAINRMTTYFIIVEEYEKCQFLQEFVKDNMPDFEIVPDEAIRESLNSL